MSVREQKGKLGSSSGRVTGKTSPTRILALPELPAAQTRVGDESATIQAQPLRTDEHGGSLSATACVADGLEAPE